MLLWWVWRELMFMKPYCTCHICLASMSLHVSLQMVPGAEPLSTQTPMIELPLPSEFSNAWLGCTNLKRLFHSWGIGLDDCMLLLVGLQRAHVYEALITLVALILPACLLMCLFR